MSGDELDRTIEFLLQSAARSEAQHARNLLEHERIMREHTSFMHEHERIASEHEAQHARNMEEHSVFDLHLRALGEMVQDLTAMLSRTLTAMNRREKRQDLVIAELAQLIRGRATD